MYGCNMYKQDRIDEAKINHAWKSGAYGLWATFGWTETGMSDLTNTLI